ncbi:MAG: hypothetical protein LLG04_11080 [Parachlamydia sp.]|nr:hypothetical protein [Parachlamydia sp.]
MFNGVSQTISQSVQSVNQQQGIIAGATSVIFSSAKQAFANLAQALSFSAENSLPSKKQVDEKYASEKAALAGAFSSQEMVSLSESLAYREDKREMLLEFLLGKAYGTETATAFDNYVFDILVLAESDFYGEEFNQRLQGLDKIGAGNAFTLLAAGYKYAESLAQNSNLPVQEKNEILQSKQRFERALLSHLRKHPDAAQELTSGTLALNLAQVDVAFMRELESKQKAEDQQVKESEQSDNKKRLILGIALIALTLGAAAGGAYHLYQRHQGARDTASVAPKPPAVPEAKPASPYGPELPEDLCQGPESKLCEKNMSIPRVAMPQLDKEVTESFVKSWKRENVTVEHETVAASSLFATQKEILRSKVQGIVKSFQEGTYNPCADTILVARRGDDHVLDGHHRWAACLLIGGEISITRFDRPIDDLLEKANTFPGVEHHNLHQFDFSQKKI